MAAAAEEEALKSNTDCVYFLASPLTCKKGAECEYRHSDNARLNPRDCYYWLSGNCLNPTCAFRHPPLEGMLGPQVAAPSVTALLPPQSVSSAPHNSAKKAVPCIFFQKGFCLKGGMCPFSHGTVLANNSKAPQGPVAAAAYPESSTIKKPSWGIAKCSTEQKVAEAYKPPKQTHVPIQSIPPSKRTPAKEQSSERHARHSSSIKDYAPNYRQATPLADGDIISRTNRVQEVDSPENYNSLEHKSTDEISREPSPGFDVLVGDQRRESDYYPEEDQYDRQLTPVNDCNTDQSVDYIDYGSRIDADRDRYHDPDRDDSYNRTRGHYGKDQRRVSSERISEVPGRRRYCSGDSPDRVNGSDLRYRLSKNRKVNGLRSVITCEVERDVPCWPVKDRLRGRVKLPGRSTSPLNGRGFLRGGGRGNSRGRVQDRIKGDGGRGFRGFHKREVLYDGNGNFAHPKSLTELRGRKGYESNKQAFPPGKRKYSESYEQAENDISFEGPKPLSEILKRKRGGNSYEEDPKGRTTAGKELGEDSKASGGQSLERNASDLQMDGGLIINDEVADHENEEAYVEGEGDEYEYEHVEGENYENAKEGEYAEDGDSDDFAKKIGAVFS